MMQQDPIKAILNYQDNTYANQPQFGTGDIHL
jgi:hypothetical protein